MEPLREFLETLRNQGTVRGNIRGLLHVLIGRRLSTAAGEVISTGLSWRELAALLKRFRWDPEAVAELGLDPAALPPRDRQKFWYAAIAQADVGSAAATAAGDALVGPLKKLGFIVGPAPRPSGDRHDQAHPAGPRPHSRKGANKGTKG